MKDIGKELELENGEFFMVVWPSLPPEIKRKIEDLMENEGYIWQGGGTGNNMYECHFSFKKE